MTLKYSIILPGLSTIFLFSFYQIREKSNPETILLSSFKTRTDSLSGYIVLHFDNLNLAQKISKETVVFWANEEEVFTGDLTKNSYLFEVFDSSFFLISCVEGKSVAAGPELFDRDSMVIVDLKSSKIGKVSLPKVYLTSSREIINTNFTHKSESDLLKKRKSYYAIVDIDFKSGFIKLYNQAHNIVKYKMRVVNV